MRDTKSVITAVLIALFVLAVLDFSGNGIKVIDGFSNSLAGGQTSAQAPGPGTPRRTETVSLTQDAADLSALAVINNRGRVDLRGTQENTVQVECTITVYADQEGVAAAYLPQVAVSKNVQEGKLILTMEEPRIREARISDITVDYVVAVPAGLAVEVRDVLGVINAAGLANDLVLDGQNFQIAGVTGNVEVQSRHGVLEINGVNGNATVRGFFRNGDIRNVAGNLTLDVHLENSLYVENVAGDVVIDSIGPRPVVINTVGGRLTARNHHGGLDIRNVAGPVTVTAEHSGVNLENTRNDVRVTARSADIRMELEPGFGYTIRAGARNGNIITGLPLTVETPDPFRKKTAGTLGDGRHQVWLETEDADIYLHTR